MMSDLAKVLLISYLGILLIFCSFGNVTFGWNEFQNYYFGVNQIKDGTTSFIVNYLWLGNEWYILKGGDIENNCHRDITIFKKGVANNEKWALRMLDSSAHFQSGFLDGNIINYGNYEECVNIQEAGPNKNINGRYSLVLFKTYTNESDIPELVRLFNIMVALCLPSSCLQNNIKNVLMYGIKNDSIRLFKTITYDSLDELQKIKFGALEISIVSTAVLLLGIVLISTMYDVLNKQKKEPEILEDSLSLVNDNKRFIFLQGILSFSIYTNCRNLFKKDKDPKSIKVLHGLRCFGIFGVIFIHRLMDPQPFTNTFMLDSGIRKWYRMIFFNGYLWVDVFFLMSGLLVSYTYLIKSSSTHNDNNNKKINLWKYYLHRYTRLTPPIVAVILLELLSKNMCRGPLCPYLNSLKSDRCEKNWWATILYINNFYNPNEKCIIQSWYTSADMQLYIISPIILYQLSRNKRLVFYEVLIFSITSVFFLFYFSYMYGLRSTFIGTDEFYKKTAIYTYEPFYTRATPWLIGIVLGIVINKYKEQPFKMSKTQIISGWIISILLIVGSMFGLALFIRKDYQYDLVIDLLYKSLHKSTWSLGFAWLIYACFTGHGGFINKFLSSRVFHPLSKLTYSCYLIHTFGQFLQYQTNDFPRHYDDLSQVLLVVGDIMFSFFLALFLYLFVEAPFINLEKLVWNDKGKKKIEDAEPLLGIVGRKLN